MKSCILSDIHEIPQILKKIQEICYFFILLTFRKISLQNLIKIRLTWTNCYEGAIFINLLLQFVIDYSFQNPAPESLESLSA